MPSRSAIPNEVRDATLTLGKTKEELIGKKIKRTLGRTM
jgi:ABC-type phosphate transport system permease subunit